MTTRGLDALSLPNGRFAMLALDQRESLRTIIAERTAAPVSDADLRAFKVAAARALTPLASGVLLDAEYGLDPVLGANAVAAGCGLIVASDALVQEPGGPVEDTRIDERVDPTVVARLGAVALKLLVIWRSSAAERLEAMADAFVERCHGAGLAAIVEGIVRPARVEERELAIVEAAARLGASGTDLYKAEVPFHGVARSDEIAAWSARITAALPCPWVVLSNGVEADRFPDALSAALAGGAAGFLAGRAVWTDSIDPSGSIDQLLASRAVERFRVLRAIVESS